MILEKGIDTTLPISEQIIALGEEAIANNILYLVEGTTAVGVNEAI